jgi:hypothetical protein
MAFTNIITDTVFPFIKDKFKGLVADLAEKLFDKTKLHSLFLQAITRLNGAAELTDTNIDNVVVDILYQYFEKQENFEKWFDTIVSEFGFVIVPKFSGTDDVTLYELK